MQYSISEFAKKLNISPHTLRYYEKEQILWPTRTSSGHRAYSDKDINWMIAILRLKETGMSIKDIKHYAALYAQGNTTLKERGDMLKKHQHYIDTNIALWLEHKQKLQEKIQRYEMLCMELTTE